MSIHFSVLSDELGHERVPGVVATVQRAVVVYHGCEVVLSFLLSLDGEFGVDYQEISHSDFGLKFRYGLKLEGEAFDEQQKHFGELDDALALDDSYASLAKAALEAVDFFVFEVVRDQVFQLEGVVVERLSILRFREVRVVGCVT